MNDEPSHVHWNGCGAKKNHLGSSQSVWKRPQSWRVADSDHQIWGNVELDLFRLDFIFLPPWHGIYISIQLISWHYIIPALHTMSQVTVKLCFSSMFFFSPFAPSILADFSVTINAFLDTVCNLISIPCCRWSWPSTVSFLIAVKYTKLGFSDFSLEFIHICQLQAFPHLSITATPVICNNISLFLFHGFGFQSVLFYDAII